ncbi:RNA-binding protein pop5 [Kalmusia sp. IMI 367209]|nr:RNA-binding protein pop5 [Kalmusia sp. IMI 367209]
MVRVKNRYLVINILYPTASTAIKSEDAVPELVQFHAPTPDGFHTGLLLRLIRDGIAELYGDYGMGMANRTLKGSLHVLLLNSPAFVSHVYTVNYWSPATSTAIIRCPREHYEMVWAALTFITKLPRPIDTPVVFKVVRVSGTIRKAEEEVIRRAKLIIRRAKAAEAGKPNQMLESINKAVDRRAEPESSILAQVDDGDESESESE